MSQKKNIVLIDDDHITNALNKIIIERSKFVDDIILFGEAKKALEYFTSDDGSTNIPDTVRH
jgi:hypothetical protein